MSSNKPYRIPSKVMLTGEYGVVIGGSALTIPFHRYYARVRDTGQVPRDKKEEATQSTHYLRQLYAYVASLPEGSFHAAPDLPLFRDNLHRYWLEMTIPTGYGLGSSGAVSAAVYDLFFPDSNHLPLEQQKEDLALIESYFHGKSSGVDALTCFRGISLYFGRDGSIRPAGFDPENIRGGYRFFLLDSGERFETGPLVKRFLERVKDPGFESLLKEEYLMLNQKLIEALLGEREADPALLVRLISEFQWHHFRTMIPDSVHDVWIEGQVSNEYYLKLNGSGGGFMLGITHRDSMETLEERWKKDLIWIP
jgi:mevalonate kinase